MTCNVAPSVTDYLSWSSCSNKLSVPSGGNMNGYPEGIESGRDCSRPLSREPNHNNDADAKSLKNSVSKKHRNEKKEDEYQKAKRELMKNPNFVRFENGWSEHISRSGKHYYFHYQTKKTVWERPVEMSQPKASHNLVRIEGEWSEHISSSGNHYYYNSKTKESVWEKPKGFFSNTPKTTPTSKVACLNVPTKSISRESPDSMTPNCSSHVVNVPSSKQCSNADPSDKIKSSMSRETLKMMIQKMNENHQSKSELSARSAPSGMARQDSGGTLQRKRSYRSSEEIVNSAGEHRKLSSTGTNQSFDGGTGSNKMTTATALTHQQQQETNSPIEYQQQQSCSSLLSNGASSTSTLQSSVDHWMNHSYNNTSTNGNDVTQTVASSHNSYRSATEDWAFISNYNTSTESKQDERIETSAKSGSSKRSRNSHSNQELKPKGDIYGAKPSNVNESLETIHQHTKTETMYSYSPCKKPRRGSLSGIEQSFIKISATPPEETVEKDLLASPEDPCQSPGVSEDGIAKPETHSSSFTLPPSPQREELPPSMHFYDPELVMHICEWPSASQEAQILKNMQDESKQATQVFQTTVDLKFLRSVVRANEIQATLQQARIHFIREQILELENTNVNLGVGTSIEGGGVASPLPASNSGGGTATNTCSVSSLIGQGNNVGVGENHMMTTGGTPCSSSNSATSDTYSLGTATGGDPSCALAAGVSRSSLPSSSSTSLAPIALTTIPLCLNYSSKSPTVHTNVLHNNSQMVASNGGGSAVTPSSSHFYPNRKPPLSQLQQLTTSDSSNSSSTSSKHLTTSLDSSAAAAATGPSMATT